jgi:proteasome-associated ATPase
MATDENVPRSGRPASDDGRLLEAKTHIARLTAQNEKLEFTLREARDHIGKLREEVSKLTTPPLGYGVIVGRHDDGQFDVVANGRKLRVSAHPALAHDDLEIGTEVVLNDASAIVAVTSRQRTGELATLKEILEDGTRVVVSLRGDDDRVFELATSLRGRRLRTGDVVVVEPRTELVIEQLRTDDFEHLFLEEVPNVGYDNIGGLADQIEHIADAVELPFLHPELFTEYQLPAPKGILLYGPPGCGKTLIAKAVANSLAKKVAARDGDDKAKSYFINVKGPELLNKYVGETERHIRLIFQRAREKSFEGWPVIVFFDEMDSMFRIRGSGISSDMESTIVPQLLAEIDGVESLKNVIVIGATNREDLIDPAILRPGRLDVKIKIDRPNQDAARQIFARYLTSDVPLLLADGTSLEGLIDETVTSMYLTGKENEFLEVTYQTGDKEVLHFKDFASGAMIENIVRRAKKSAIKRELAGGSRGVSVTDLIESVREEFHEHEDLPNTTNPDDWARISGRRGERIVFVRTLRSAHDDAGSDLGGKAIERAVTGQYL